MSIFVASLLLTGCSDERSLSVVPDSFEVKASDYLALANDTFVVKANEKVTFNFPAGCPDEILYYSGESGFEYRFGNRSTYQSTDNTQFESKISISTTVGGFDAAVAKDYSLIAISGLGKSSVSEFNASQKTELMKLRATSTSNALFPDSFKVNTKSTPIDLSFGTINLAVKAKSADATKNLLSIASSGISVVNTEIRNYGYSREGVTVVNKKTITYPVISTTLSSATWAQYAPDSTVAPGASTKVLNASGYAWNMGEIGVSYAPAITGGAVSVNKNGVSLATAYPLSVTVPKDESKVVVDGSPSETWLISRGFNPAAVLSDAATVVKKVDQSSLKYYQYIYKEKGVYKASFVGINVGTNGTQKVVRHLVILVQ